MASIGCIDCKKLLRDAVIKVVDPIRQKRIELAKAGDAYFIDILREGGKKARKVIRKVVAEAKQKAGVPSY